MDTTQSTPATDTTGAYLEPHAYDSYPEPVPFWIVRCDHPSHGPIALNAGHHYREHVKRFAESLAAEHNASEHGDHTSPVHPKCSRECPAPMMVPVTRP